MGFSTERTGGAGGRGSASRHVLAALWLMALAAPAQATQIGPTPTWWTHLGVTNGLNPVRIAYYIGARNPNKIGPGGLMGFSDHGADPHDNWRPMPQPPQLNTFGAFHCSESTGDYSHVLVTGEKTYRCVQPSTGK